MVRRSRFAHHDDPGARSSPRAVPPAIGDDAELLPVMEIHGVPRADVEAMLRAGGLDIVTVQDTDKAAGWHDYWYVAVQARARRATAGGAYAICCTRR